jgi:hypothetical protein
MGGLPLSFLCLTPQNRTNLSESRKNTTILHRFREKTFGFVQENGKNQPKTKKNQPKTTKTNGFVPL